MAKWLYPGSADRESTQKPPANFHIDSFALYATIVVISLGASLLLVGTYGNLEATLALILALTIVFLSFYHVDMAFLVLVGMVLLFDQFIVVPFGDPITDSVRYFDNLKQIPFLPPISAGVMNPIEIQLALILFGWFLGMCTRRNSKVQPVPFWGLGILFTLAVVLSLGHGLATGGEFLTSLWEVRALFYFLLIYFLVPQIIQTREQLSALIWIFIVVIAIKDFQGAARFAQLGFHFKGNLSLTNHEDPIFTADIIIFMIALAVLGVRVRQRAAITLLLPVLLVGFYASERRTAYAALIVSMIALVIMLQKSERARFYRYLVPIFIFIVCYSAVFWNAQGQLAAPVQMIKSGLVTDKADDGDHYTSNLYRELERFDLAATVQKSPVVGIGFGNKYLQPLPLVPIPFPLRDWIPHDEILWLIVKMGGLGFLIFWLMFDALLFHTAALGRRLRDPFLRAVCILIAAAIVNQMVASYYDLQLTFYRNMIFLGTLCGLLPTLELLDKNFVDKSTLAKSQTEGIKTP